MPCGWNLQVVTSLAFSRAEGSERRGSRNSSPSGDRLGQGFCDLSPIPECDGSGGGPGSPSSLASTANGKAPCTDLLWAL